MMTATARAKPAHYPTQPIKVIVPFAAGGGGDTVARVMGQGLAELTGASVIIENRPGAAGVVGSNVVLKSAPDGYTLLNMSNSYAIQAAVTPQLPFDPIGDLQPIIMIARTPNLLVVRKDSPFRNAEDFIAAARKDPDRYTHGSAGVGSIAHLGVEYLAFLTGIKLVHVPYKGSSQAMNDLLGGSVDMVMSTATFLTPYVNSGRVRVLGMTGTERLPTLPGVQTFEEQGIKGYNVGDWKAWGGPKGIPPDVVQYLNEELNKVLKTRPIVERFNAEGTLIVGGSPQQMMDIINQDVAGWKKFVAMSKIKVE
jgi:tripartite-type tricarboxylate transporter receptor subunit TctC